MKYSEAWKLAKKNHDPNKKQSRLKEIFNPDSQNNKELELFNKICNQNKPDLDLELEKLGFIKKIKVMSPDYYAERYCDLYVNDNNDLIELFHGFGLTVYFNDDKKVIDYSDEIGKEEKQALNWIKEKLNESNNRI